MVIELLCDTSTPGESTDGVGVGLKTKKEEEGKKQNERKKNTSKVPRIYIEMSGMISELRSLHAFVLPYSI